MDIAGEITSLLGHAKEGDRRAVSQLFRVMRKELRTIAGALMRNERPGRVLQPTALINELYLRLFAGQKLDVNKSEEFYRLAARVMRNVLIDDARRRNAAMRRGEAVELEDRYAGYESSAEQMALLSLALRRLRQQDLRCARIFEMSYFAGREPNEISALLAVNVRTIQRELQMARIWLKRELIGANVTRAVGKS